MQVNLTLWVFVGASVALTLRWVLLRLAAAEEKAALQAGGKSGRKASTSAKPDGPGASKRAFVEVIDSLLVALALVFFIVRIFVIQAFFIPSESMRDTLLIHDRVVVNRFVYRFQEPHRGDIVVFRAPRAADLSNTEFIKRLVGLPGDHIRVEGGSYGAEGQVFINGEPIEEPYIRQSPDYDFPDLRFQRRRTLWMMEYKLDAQHMVPVELQVVDGKPIIPPDRPLLLGDIEGRDMVIPDGHYLMFGDNRNYSNDGHAWGLVPREALVGRAEFIFWPIQRARILFPPSYGG